MIDIEEARWNLYWRAWMDILKTDEHPNDEHTPERKEDFRLWLDKVQKIDWFIAPGVTEEDRVLAGLPIEE